jgi:hypothetical protein
MYAALVARVQSMPASTPAQQMQRTMMLQQGMEFIKQQEALKHRQSQEEMARTRADEMLRYHDMTYDSRTKDRESRESIASDKLAIIPRAEREKNYRNAVAGLGKLDANASPQEVEQYKQRLDELQSQFGVEKYAKTYDTVHGMGAEEKRQLEAIANTFFTSAGSTRKPTYLGLSHEDIPNAIDKQVIFGGHTWRIHGTVDDKHIDLED